MSDKQFAPVDSSVTTRYAEIATFMRAARTELSSAIDIALVGVPLDLRATFRSGARHGPAGVREASRLIRQVNPTTGVAPYRLANIADVGDAPTHPLSVEISVERIQAFLRSNPLSGRGPDLDRRGPYRAPSYPPGDREGPPGRTGAD
jgi:guanidinopropionase